MNRRLFLTSGISMIALSRMAKGLEDSPFFKGTIPDGPFLPYWESLKAYRCPRLVSGCEVRNLGPLEPTVCARTGRLVRAEYVLTRDASI